MAEFRDDEEVPEYRSDYDEDADLGIPSQFTQRTMLSQAVVEASKIDRELRGQAHGMLADYVEFALNESATAAALLLTMHPKSERELFELQKRAAPYASVMQWLRGQYGAAKTAQFQLEEVERKQEYADE